MSIFTSSLDRVTVVREVSFWNALDPIFVTWERSIEVIAEQLKKALDDIVVTPLGRLVRANLEQPEKAFDDMSVTLLGKLVRANLVQFRNAYEPMLVIPFGRLVRARLEH